MIRQCAILFGCLALGELIVIVLMFIGRVGVLTLISSLIKQKKITKYKYPSDNIIIN